jgi:hypothetical protein
MVLYSEDDPSKPHSYRGKDHGKFGEHSQTREVNYILNNHTTSADTLPGLPSSGGPPPLNSTASTYAGGSMDMSGMSGMSSVLSALANNTTSGADDKRGSLGSVTGASGNTGATSISSAPPASSSSGAGHMTPTMGNTPQGGSTSRTISRSVSRSELKAGGTKTKKESGTATPTSGVAATSPLTSTTSLTSTNAPAKTSTTSTTAVDVERKDRETVELDEPFDQHLLYHPMAVFSRMRKITQLSLIAAKIERLKRRFNKVFEYVREAKVDNLDQIKRKMGRIMDIQREMKINEPITFPTLSMNEIADSVLVVTDLDLPPPKAAMATSSSVNELSLDANGRPRDLVAEKRESDSRALKEMMNGTLETKKDLSQLDEELVRPSWMTDLGADVWTEEQKLQFALFERKEKALKTERDTRQRLLESELKKAKSDVNDICRMFDTRLKTLWNSRLLVAKRIHREELSILNLVHDLLEEEQMLDMDHLLQRCMEDLTGERTRRLADSERFKRALEKEEKKRERMLNDERNMEKNFRRVC